MSGRASIFKKNNMARKFEDFFIYNICEKNSVNVNI